MPHVKCLSCGRLGWLVRKETRPMNPRTGRRYLYWYVTHHSGQKSCYVGKSLPESLQDQVDVEVNACRN